MMKLKLRVVWMDRMVEGLSPSLSSPLPPILIKRVKLRHSPLPLSPSFQLQPVQRHHWHGRREGRGSAAYGSDQYFGAAAALLVIFDVIKNHKHSEKPPTTAEKPEPALLCNEVQR